MGEGSENGTVKTPGQVGNLIHPWLIQSVQGSQWLEPSDNNYNEAYQAFGSDIALLEIASDTYQNPVESTPTWGLFSVYQGCVWGQDGCDDPTLASANIDSEIDGLNSEVNDIEDDYTFGANDPYAAFGYESQMANVEASIEYNLAEQIHDLEVEVDTQEQEAADQWVVTDNAFKGMTPAEQATTDGVGTYPSCYNSLTGSTFWCSSSETLYVNELDEYYVQYGQYTTAKSELSAEYRNPNITGPDGQALQVSLAQRMEQVDRYKTLCGVDLEDTSCSGGLILTREDQRTDIDSISVALGQGVTRRGGLDIGSKFTFKFLDANNPDPDNPLRTDYIDIDMKGVYLDGSYFRLWAREDSNGNAELNANISLNLYAKEINIATCGSICEAPGMEQAMADSTLYLDNFLLNLNLGHGDMQAVKFSSTSDGNFILELETPKSPLGEDGQPIYAGAQETYEAFYNDSQKSYLYVGNIQLGTDPSKNLGSITIDGLRASYLKVTSHDL